MGGQENQIGQTYWHTLVPLLIYIQHELWKHFFLLNFELNLILIVNVYQRASIPWLKCSESLNLGHEWRGERVIAVHKTDFCAFPCSVWYNSCDFVSDFEVLEPWQPSQCRDWSLWSPVPAPVNQPRQLRRSFRGIWQLWQRLRPWRLQQTHSSITKVIFLPKCSIS